MAAFSISASHGESKASPLALQCYCFDIIHFFLIPFYQGIIAFFNCHLEIK